ncbi:S8 family peptidase [Vallitalea okinawensis]|uniref:S8 family peptidase n=1 Tax=Vallitalea okinawensis TaxID=2078660 RepID=UPI001FA81EFC|nr:S8 family peptidase [Vallitalea okinawensis]
MADNQKVDNELNLALDINKNELLKSTSLSVGYIEDDDAWEIIVKYNGDIISLADKYGALVEVLTDQYAIITISEDSIVELANENQIEYIEKPKNMKIQIEEALYDACIENVQNFPQYNLKGDGVLIGIIDSGIDYAHPDFRNEDGTTRIAYLWDQTIEGNPPEGFVFGSEYTRDQINEALQQENRQAMMEIVPSRDIIGHGTGVAGVAGGNGRASDGKYIGAAPNADFIIVKLGLKGAESFSKNSEIMRAVKYVVEKAEELNKPVAINISYGNNNGSHDGTSIFENYIDDWANRWKNVIVVGSGNEGISGKHTSGFLQDDEIKDIEVFVQANERDLSIQIWKEYEDDIEVELISPSGQSTGFLKQLLGTQKFRLDFTDILLYYGEPSPFSKAQQIYMEMVPVGDALTAGKWTIRLKANDVVTGRYDLWLPISYETSAETTFAKPTTDTTLTIPSTANKVISVGAYNSDINSIAPFSGRGYTRTDNMVKPDLVAPGVNIMTTKSGGGYDSVSGTSFAAPFVTGSAALMMQYGIVNGNDPFLYGEKVKSYLISGARRDKVNLDYPNNTWGYGTLCLQNSIDVINRFFYRQALSDSVRELNCQEVIKSDNYADIIRIYYAATLQSDAELFGADCYQVLNPTHVALHIPIDDQSCDEVYKNIPHVEVPDVYGLASRSLEAAGVSPIFKMPGLQLTGRDVLIGIIDTGIDYTHPAFIYEDNTTKIHSIWDQTGDGPAPQGYNYGTEYTEEQINEALASDDPLSIVPEKDEIGHGTFLAGIAAGREDPQENFSGAAPDSTLVIVKLKEAKKCVRDYYLIEENVPAYQSNDILVAIRYLARKSSELNMPLVILFAGETNMGPHDGNSIVERYFDSIVKFNGVVNVVPSGNEADAGHHFRGEFLMTEQQQIDMQLNVDDNERGFFINIWNYAPDKLSIALTSPTGTYTDKIPFATGKKQEITLTLEKTDILVEYQIAEVRSGDQATFIRLKNPTPGVWTITVFGDNIINGTFDAYLPQKGFIREETKFLKPDPYVTCTDPGTTSNIITVGGYNDVSRSLYFASGRGLTRSNNIKPDLVAPAVSVTGTTPDGGYSTMTGTSVASAITAGASALLLQWGIVEGNDETIDTLGARNYLIRGARRRDTLKYPNREWGYGELDLLNTFKEIQS